MPDLSPASPAQVPEVRSDIADAQVDLNEGVAFTPRYAYTFYGEDGLHGFITAIRDATLKAHRERLLALTPEEVVEAAVAVMCDFPPLPPDAPESARKGDALLREHARKDLRAVLPVLLGPEVARREQAERTMAELARKTNVAEMAREQAEAERDAARLENEEGTRICIETDQRYGAEVSRREAAERELADFKADVLKHTGDPLAASLAYEAGMRDGTADAEGEVSRLKGALERYRGMVSDDSIAEAPVTPKCATPPDARKYGAVHPAPVSPATDKGLDFEAAKEASAVRTSEAGVVTEWLTDECEAHLNAQHLAALERARDEWKRSAEEQLDARLLNAQRFAAAEAEATRLRAALESLVRHLHEHGDPKYLGHKSLYPILSAARAALGGSNG